MKKIWFGIGAVVIIILLLLQTRFNIFLRLDYDGYASPDKSVKAMLLTDPEEVLEEDIIDMYGFKPLEYIYTRGNSYYLGEEKKSTIDLSFPLLINGGSGVWFVDESSTLFDINYDEYTTYRALSVSDRLSYNPGGDQADATEFLFAGLRNGFFINLDSFTFDDVGRIREVPTNSFIYFTKDYFTYLEQIDDGQLRYQICRAMPSSGLVTVDGEDMTYYQLLVKLHVISDGNKSNLAEEPIPEEIIPTPEVLDVIEEPVVEETKGNPDPTPGPTKTPRATTTKKKSGGAASGGGNSKSASTKSLGVRPDSARPDKKERDKKKKPVVVDYVKPTVDFKSITAGVYRIMPTVTVYDPANRISSVRRIEFEYYEVTRDSSGKIISEKPVYRNNAPGYTREPKDVTVTAGDGSIKPATEYRVNIQFTYYNEYDETVTESVKSDIYVTTLPFDPTAKVVIKNDQSGDKKYPDIPVYYDKYVSIENVAYDKNLSDEEAVYGLDPRAVIITIEGISNPSFKYEAPIDSGALAEFKRGNDAVFETLPALEPNSEYRYTITAKDFFKNDITIENNTGTFFTCKSRPTGTIKLDENKIGNTKFTVSITDNDASSIAPENGSSGIRDVYFVVSTKKNTEQSKKASIWTDCEDYLTNGKTETGAIHYMIPIPRSESGSAGYTVDSTTGAITLPDLEIPTNSLDLNQRYYVYLLGDFNLNNKQGDIRHAVLGEMDFRSATLSSLGNIYITVDIANVNAHSALITYTLNDQRTVDELQALLSSIDFRINVANADVTDSHIVFDQNAIDLFSGYKGEYGTRTRDDGTTPYPIGSVVMDAKYFDQNGPEGATDVGEIPYYLTSKTEYQIKPVVKALYNGKEYDMNCVLTKSTFKTMKEPAKVEVKDLIFAGGTLKFNTRITDEDETIIGNSGHVVVMNLYDDRYNLVKAVRIKKYTEKDQPFIQQVFTGLDPSRKYHMDFIAVEYNEGYDNTTFESNKVLYSYDVKESLNITGSIKLQGINELSSGKMDALTKVTINDTDRIMTNGMPYYVRVEKKNSEGKYEETSLSKTFSDYTPGLTITQNSDYLTDKGGDYKLTLYIMFNNNEVDLDTLYFTTEKPVVAINSAVDFVGMINRNGTKDIKYCITEDINLDAYDALPDAEKAKNNDGKTITSSNSITSIFNGQLDFQGYKLIKNKKADNTQIFNNIGPTGEVYNMVFEISDETSSGRIWDEGGLASRNYGHIHDVVVEYKGGSGVNNQHYGLLCRINAASGIIERFVVHNDPSEGRSTFSARYEAGMVCGINEGIIRNGYVYGKDINACVVSPSVGGELQVGSVAGRQTNLGQMYNVFSLCNVVIASPDRSSASPKVVDTKYGAVIGSGAGSIHNIYSVGQSKYNVPFSGTPADLVGEFNRGSIGPAIGTNVNSSKNVFYWNEAGFDYTASTRQTRIGLESLYDYSWQQSLLGNVFDTQPVEVGFYPQVIMSEEVPAQEYIPLPGKANVQPVEIVSSSVLEYGHSDEDGDYAIVEFRLSNPRNALIQEINIENLTTQLINDETSPISLDGYTTLKAKVYNPQKYLSAYNIKSLKAQFGSYSQTLTYDPDPILYVDFYRNVSNAQEWYDYVVKKPTENARLTADIDFADPKTDSSRIVVTSEYTGKLDGANHTISNIYIEADSKSNHNFNPTLFRVVSGQINNLVVDGLTTRMGSRNKDRGGMIYQLNGSVNNVHLKNVDIEGYGYIGALTSYMYAGSEMQDCSASNVKINYTEPANTNTNGRIGGLVGYANSCHIRSCFVRNEDISILDIKNCEGAGGIVGYTDYAGLENLYATGKIVARGINVGGIAGYHYASEVSNVLKNLIAKVDVTSYQNAVGGLIGNLNLSGTLTETNNMTGISFGNVFCNNSDSEDVSYTIGYMTGYRGVFYGSDFQLINGMVNTPMDQNTLGLISYAQATDSGSYTDKSLLRMEDVYNYSKADNGYIPTLYYYGTTKELPFQEEDIEIANTKREDDLISVKNIYVNKNEETITLDLVGPAGYKITQVILPKDTLLLKSTDSTRQRDTLYYAKESDFLYSEVFNANNSARVVFNYLTEQSQDHFVDSYSLIKIAYANEDGSKVGVTDFTRDPVRIPLVLYKDIPRIEVWNQYINKTELRNYGNYENYRITGNIDFSTDAWDKNAKLGRLIGGNLSGGKYKLTNIKYDGKSENFIFRLNSELSNISIENCTEIKPNGRDCAGLIGTSAANIFNVDFKNINITNTTQNQFVGIIGYQIGGYIGREDTEIVRSDGSKEIEPGGVTLENITVNNIVSGGTSKLYTGGLVGYAKTGTKFQNITAHNVTVNGSGRVGGLVGTTGKAYFRDITASDFKVQSVGNYERVGGIVGSYEPGRTSGANGAEFVRVSLTGTPSMDSNGNIISSTTEVSMSYDSASDPTTCNYIGGLVGWSGAYYQGRDNTPTSANTVDGVVVRGLGNYIGGLYGYVYDTWYGRCTNTLITTSRNTQGVFSYVGGISGATPYYYKYNDVDNVTINMVNHSHMGLSLGRKTSSTNSEYNKVENSKMIAAKVGENEVSRLGGFCGSTDGQMIGCTVYNSTIDAATANMVGGIAGSMANNMYRSFYYASPASSSSPEASSDYFIKGYDHVGGVAGYHYSSIIDTVYSNANVEATNNYAGGFDGLYRNNYTVTIVSGENNYAYSSTGIRRSYFAGTVKANNYAGGFVGDVGIKSNSGEVKDEATRLNGGRRSAKDGSLLKTGSSNEVDYTYQNMLFASTIEATGGNDAYAFAGNVDGFEGKANTYKATSYDLIKDVSGKDRAYRTYFWDGTLIKTQSDSTGQHLADLKNTSTPDIARNTFNNPEYKYTRYANLERGYYTDSAGSGVIPDCEIRASFNVRLISTDDLKTHGPYYSIEWCGDNKAHTTGGNSSTWVGKNNRIIMVGSYNGGGGPGDTRVPGAKFTEFTDTGNYLPLVRVNNDSTVASQSDYLTNYQVSKGIVLPIPSGYTTSRALKAAARPKSTIAAPNVYASDVDKINVEFGPDAYPLRPGADPYYFKLYYGNEVVAKKIIDKRVFTFTYDFKKPLRVEYGKVDMFNFTCDMSDLGYNLPGVDYQLEDAFENDSYLIVMSAYVPELESDNESEGENGDESSKKAKSNPNYYKPVELSHHVMTYGNRYYYINEDGVVSGLGNTNEEGIDTTAELIRGDFRTIYNGKGLLKTGEVVDLNNGGRVLKTVEGVKEVALKPLVKMRLNGSDIDTFWKHSQITSSDVTREYQVLKSKNGESVILDGTMGIIKDSVVLYTKDGKSFVTVLGSDHIMVDLYQGDNLNAPEDFKPSGIVYMNNNFETSAPFIVVEYQNGGVVGYNYMTGEYLFNNFINNTMSLMDYARVFFAGDKSLLAEASASYAATSRVAQIASDPERLYKLVEENSSGEKVLDNNVEGAETATDEGTEKYLAGDETGKSGDRTKLRDLSSSTVQNSGAEYNLTGEAKGTLEENAKPDKDSSIGTGGEGGQSEGTSMAAGDGGSLGKTGSGGVADGLDLETNVAGSGKSSPAGTFTLSGDSTANGIGSAGESSEKTANGNGAGGANSADLEELPDPSLLDGEGTEDIARLYKETKDNLTDEQIAALEAAKAKDKDEESGNSGDGKIAEDKINGEGTGNGTSTGIDIPVTHSLSEYKDEEKDGETTEESVDSVKVDAKLSMVYNQSTGTYEIIDLDKFLTDSSYVSENARLGVSDFAAYGGYATEVKNDTDKETKRGLALYILAAFAVLAGVGGGIYYKKKNNLKV